MSRQDRLWSAYREARLAFNERRTPDTTASYIRTYAAWCNAAMPDHAVALVADLRFALAGVP